VATQEKGGSKHTKSIFHWEFNTKHFSPLPLFGSLPTKYFFTLPLFGTLLTKDIFTLPLFGTLTTK
jgi:hypothetical protein